MRRKDREVNSLQEIEEILKMCNEGEPVFMDAPCNSGYYYSSIIGNGTVEFINRSEDKCHALTAMFFQ